jgi:competence protein ComEC
MVGIILFPIYLILPPLSNILMPIVEIGIRLMNIIAKIFSNIPILNLTVPTPSIYQLIIYYIVLFYMLNIGIDILIKSEKTQTKLPVIYSKNIYTKRFVLICGIISILIVGVVPQILPQPLEITMLDVGHGDSILITTPHKKTILIDTGDSYSYDGKTYDSGEQTVVPYILDQGHKKIDLLILSHLDSDHIGGFKAVSKSLKIDNVGISINSNKKEGISEVEEIIKKENSRIMYLSKNQEFNIDGVNFKILLPEKKEQIEDENNDSIVILMEYQGIKTLFMGDLELDGEEKLIENTKNLDIDILKVGHHGSITSTSEALVKATTPKVALISVGTRFKSIPSKEVLDRLGSAYSKVYRTDKMGQITLKIKDGKIFSETIY